MDEEEEIVVSKKKSEAAPPKRQPKKIVIPRRTPSIVVPPKQIVYITPDKTTCVECPCFPKEEPYVYPKKLNPCLTSPETLYHLAALAVDKLCFPPALTWSEDDVVLWLSDALGLPQYKECILDNHINGMRLIMLEDPSKLAEINIKNFTDIQVITSRIRQLFSTEFIRFARSVGLPPRKPLTHCTWFKSRSGPTWGIRKNWTRYQAPDFPKTKFARIGKATTAAVPRYQPQEDICREYLVPRKFRFQTGIRESQQLIWMETPIPQEKQEKLERKVKEMKKEMKTPKGTRLYPNKISLAGLHGKDLVLARRKMPRPKFFAS